MDKKKIINNILSFIRSNSIALITLVLVFQIFLSLKGFPYLNLIRDFYIYVFFITLILGYFLLLKYLTARRLIIITVVLLVISFPFLVFHQESISNFFGFVIFVLLLGAVLITVSRERKNLRV
ncbi:hypothetical protein A3A74_05490 [Candidatus Roizmanbacteria bacterium RIFCSPLOWO2_01_FULL_35_13]|uniref:Uncharacterized protein n=1 Tax=Candidatus Roizmanbacteria bacterium RIFCSPLOWO2_01_FULL_35_13 TaxID=1802055 RepID=A0A1F7I958_9BACT|nr:MAG: hypothetical protein A3A74_05490 [Candidatus Roizmanbacteria bacterium RIFCSPLOWO2_01_FULL_35_13]